MGIYNAPFNVDLLRFTTARGQSIRSTVRAVGGFNSAISTSLNRRAFLQLVITQVQLDDRTERLDQSISILIVLKCIANNQSEVY